MYLGVVIMQTGFKHLLSANWQEPDPVSVALLGSLGPEQFADIVLQPTLEQLIPEDVHKLFLVAQGSILYGYYFYPLYALGLQQLYRVLEAAVTHKCVLMGRNDMKNFGTKIQWLCEIGTISPADKAEWDSIRQARNLASHLEDQMIVSPAMVINAPKVIAERINELFQA
jgi:hypothetical protein